MKKIIFFLVLMACWLGCTSQEPRSQHDQEILHQLLVSQPGDLIEFQSGELARIGGRAWSYRDAVLFGCITFHGFDFQNIAIYPGTVKHIYHHEGKIVWNSLDVAPRNPERDEWKEAAARYVLDVTPEK